MATKGKALRGARATGGNLVTSRPMTDVWHQNENKEKAKVKEER
jgi:hypothetical protein